MKKNLYNKLEVGLMKKENKNFKKNHTLKKSKRDDRKIKKNGIS